MEHVAVFSLYVSSLVKADETEAEKWLSEMGDTIEITRVLQSSSGAGHGEGSHRTTLTIFYKKL